MAKRKKRLTYNQAYVALGAIVVVLILFNISQSVSLKSLIDDKVVEAEEANKPAEISLAVIRSNECRDCSSVDDLLEQVKGSNVEVDEEETLDINADRAQELIEQYGVARVPTILIFGEIDKLSFSNFETQEDALVFNGAPAPFVNAETNEVEGRVHLTTIQDSSCAECENPEFIKAALTQAQVHIASDTTLERTSAEGQALLERYEINVLPAMIISKDLAVYGGEITDAWSQIGSIEADGSYITRLSNPPYVDLIEERIVGLVDITFITDETCDECYEVDVFHRAILSRMGVALQSEETVDVSSSAGAALVEQYDIGLLPTVILRGDVAAYPVLDRAWQDVGTVEEDGSYIFRRLDVTRQSYKNWTSGEVISIGSTI